jgi:mono/diheme cytochrome c family protein
MKRSVNSVGFVRRLGDLTGLVMVAVLAAGCNQMAQQQSVDWYEEPFLAPTTGTVALDESAPLPPREQADRLRNPLTKTSETLVAGRQVYRRFCWPCHGPQFDGNGPVGPSFPRGNLDLLAPRVVNMSDGEIYWILARGSDLNPPLAEITVSTERWQVITYLRAVQAGEIEPGG